jgi:Tat protein translocase TatB subunit
MFDIGFGEMIMLAAIALIAIGPKQLPEVARTVGKLIGEFKKAVGEVTETVASARNETDRALRGVSDDLLKSIKEAQQAKPIEPLPDHPGETEAVTNPSAGEGAGVKSTAAVQTQVEGKKEG